MSEQFKSITDARKELPTLATTVEGGSDRVVITNQGKPQAVLLGYDDFKGLLAAVELMNHPRELAQLHEGLADTQRISFADLKKNLEAGKPAASLVEEPVAAEPVEDQTINWIRKSIDSLNSRIDDLVEQYGKVKPLVPVPASAYRRLSPEKEKAVKKAFRLLDETPAEYLEMIRSARSPLGGRARGRISAGIHAGRRSRAASGE
jgi:prevent-host-death family protein